MNINDLTQPATFLIRGVTQLGLQQQGMFSATQNTRLIVRNFRELVLLRMAFADSTSRCEQASHDEWKI